MRSKQAEAVALFRDTFGRAVEGWRITPRRLAHPLIQRLPDVIAIDTTLLQVADSLRAAFPRARSTPAHVKVLLSLSVFGRLPLAAGLVVGHHHDLTLFPALGSFQLGTVLLFDKGFVAYDRLRQVAHAGLQCLCPMRLNGNALIVGVNQAPKRVRLAVAAHPDGVGPRGVLPSTRRLSKSWDLQVLVYPKTSAVDRTPVATRLVVVPGPKGHQRPYLSTLPAAEWAPGIVAEAYHLRWQVELVFKELKQDLKLERLPSKDQHTVQILAWASLIALAVSRTISGCFDAFASLVGLAASPASGPVRPSTLLWAATRGHRSTTQTRPLIQRPARSFALANARLSRALG